MEELNVSLHPSGQFVAYGSLESRTGGLYASVDGQSWSLYRNISETVPGPIVTVFAVQAGHDSTLVALVGFVDHTVGSIVMSQDTVPAINLTQLSLQRPS